MILKRILEMLPGELLTGGVQGHLNSNTGNNMTGVLALVSGSLRGNQTKGYPAHAGLDTNTPRTTGKFVARCLWLDLSAESIFCIGCI
jgi:hypothetical protein